MTVQKHAWLRRILLKGTEQGPLVRVDVLDAFRSHCLVPRSAYQLTGREVSGRDTLRDCGAESSFAGAMDTTDEHQPRPARASAYTDSGFP